MRSIVVDQPGGPEVMELRDIPAPAPGPGQLFVKVSAAGVNFVDIYQRSGQYHKSTPFTPGMEGAGEIRALGEGVTGFEVGQRVAWAMVPGAYAQYALVPADRAVPVPDGVGSELAAASILQGMTAHFLANSVVPLESGDVALVHAGAGGVGLLITQILSRIGVRVITTTSTPDKAEKSRAVGAVEVAGYDDFVDVVRQYTEGKGARVVFDGVGASTFERGFDALRTRGTMVLFGQSSGPVDSIDPQLLNTKGSLFLTRPSLAHYVAERDELLWRAESLFGMLTHGDLDVAIGARYPLAAAAAAHTDLAERRTCGKLLLIP